jgi:ankyrin repeat protein
MYNWRCRIICIIKYVWIGGIIGIYQAVKRTVAIRIFCIYIDISYIGQTESNINEVNLKGETALHLAAKNNSMGCVLMIETLIAAKIAQCSLVFPVRLTSGTISSS